MRLTPSPNSVGRKTMIRYRKVLQCTSCKKIYTNYWKSIFNIGTYCGVCPKCGSEGNFRVVIAKPKIIRLFGWKVKRG